MTFSGHLAIAGLSLLYLENPAAVIAANLAAHPLLDMVPHAEWTSFKDSRAKMIAVTVLDWVLALGVIGLVLAKVDRPVGLVAGAFTAAMWMDIVELPARRFWPAFHYFHDFTHSWPMWPADGVEWEKTATGRTPTWLKILVQTAVALIPAWLIWKA